MAKLRKEEAGLDMTPMIDVVFQMIIFFVVTLRLEENINKEIELPDSRYGEIMKKEASGSAPSMFTIEVDRKGRISVRGIFMDRGQLEGILRVRYKRYGEFPILIRGDMRAVHQQIRAVMDLCTATGIARLNFAGVYEHAKSNKKDAD